MYDTSQKRDLAVNRYQTLLSADNNTGPAEIARRHMQQPYQYK